MNSLPQSLELPFLGNRNYLHGTTLLDALLPHLPERAQISFKFAHEIRSDRVKVFDPSDQPNEEWPATLRWNNEDCNGMIAVLAQERSENIARATYDEARVGAAARINETEITLEGVSPFGFLATLVPLFKTLLAELGESGPGGQWMFTRLDAAYVPTAFERIDLRLDSILSHRVARSKIRCDGKDVATLYYLWRWADLGNVTE